MAITVASHNGLASGHILLAGTEEQKRKYLPDLASGKNLGAWGLTEPGSGSDAAGARTRCDAAADGSWSITGTKTFITQGSVGGTFVILAVTTPEKAARHHRVHRRARYPGFRAGRVLEKMGLHASDTAELILEDVRLPDSQRLGEVDHGFIDTLKILDKGRVTIAAMALGLGYGAHEAASLRPRAQTVRQVAGRVPSDPEHAGRQRGGARRGAALIRRAADVRPGTAHHAVGVDGQSCTRHRRRCAPATGPMQIHGGYGYTREYPVERHARRQALRIGEGTNEVQRMVICRQLLQRGDLPSHISLA